MKLRTLKQDKGVAGLTIFLSLIVMIFIIGLLVMIFSIMGTEMQDSVTTLAISDLQNITHETLTSNITNDTNVNVATATARDFVGTGIAVYVRNHSGTWYELDTTNWTMSSAGAVRLVDSIIPEYYNTVANVSYTYTFTTNPQAQDVMNDTVVGISASVDWFDIFIVIGAMVVLILLTVMIILSIRGSGLMTGGNSGSPGYTNHNVGSA